MRLQAPTKHGLDWKRGLAGIVVASIATAGLSFGITSPSGAAPSRTSAAGTLGNGYFLVADDGGVFAFGDARFAGSTGARTLNQPIVAAAPTPSGEGYWLAASDGGVFAFGDAQFYGSTGDRELNEPVVSIVATPSGRGYWLFASDGGVFAFGDALFHGSTGDRALTEPVVGAAGTPSGLGYWLVASDGGVFSFGDAKFFGSTGAIDLKEPVVGMAATRNGRAYYLAASDGGVFAFGETPADAPFFGSTGDRQLNRPVVGIDLSASDKGYVLAAADGGVFNFGDSRFFGSAADLDLKRPIVGVSGTPKGETVVAATASNDIVTFNSNAPGSVVSLGTVTGLAPGSSIVGLDYRPKTGELYAFAVSGTTGRLYKINETTLEATRVGTTDFDVTGATAYGFDFNPLVDRIRVVTDSDRNIRLHPDTGANVDDPAIAGSEDLALKYVAGDVNFGSDPAIVGAAYTNNFDQVPATVDPKPGTTLFDIDANRDVLARQVPPNNGGLNTVGTGLGVDISSVAAFDIASEPNGVTAAALAVLRTTGSAAETGVYAIDLTTGRAKRLGAVGDGSLALVAATIV